MKNHPGVLPRALLAALLLGSAKISFAQTGPAPAAVPPKDDEVLELSPFTVNAGEDNGYQAQNLLAGSRLKSQLKDIATPVSAFTEQFFIDTGITDTNDLANYMLSTEFSFNENAGSTGTNQNLLNGNARPVRVRGLSGGTLTTNFFATGGVADVFSSERIEQARGPNSILFGISNPGGVINTSTKRARLDRNTGLVAAGLRSYDGTRLEADYNQVIMKGKAAVRFATVRSRYGGWRLFDFRDVDGYFGTAKVKLSKTLELNVEGERTHTTKHTGRRFTALDAYTPWRDAGSVITTTDSPNAAAQVARISANPWIVIDTATGELSNWRNKNNGAFKSIPGVDNPVLLDFDVMPGNSTFYGPGFDQNIDSSRISAYLTHSWKNLNLELAGMRFDETRDTWDVPQNIFQYLHVDTNAFLPLQAGQTVAQANPNAGRAYFEGQPQHDTAKERTDFLRLSANYRFDLGKYGKHLVAGVYERNWFDSNRQSLREYIISANAPTKLAGNVNAGSNNNNRVWQRTYIDLNGPPESWPMANPQTINANGLVERVSGQTYTTAYIPFDVNTQKIWTQASNLIGMVQSTFWDDRIRTVVGASRDERKRWGTDQIFVPIEGGNGGIATPVKDPVPTEQVADNYSFSGVGRVTDWLNVTYSRARNNGIAPNSGLLHSPTGRPPAAEGKSQDYGVKMSLLDNRIYVSALRYDTSADNDFQTGVFVNAPTVNIVWGALNAFGVRDETGAVVSANTENSNAQTFSSKSKGYEFELIANLTPNWRTLLNFSILDTVQSNIGPEMLDYLDEIRPFWLAGDRGRILLDGSGLAAVAQDNDGVVETVQEQVELIDQIVQQNRTLAEGRTPIGSSKMKVNFRTNYDFTHGKMKGIGLGGGVRYWTPPVIGFNATQLSDGTISREVIRGSDQIFFDANVSYRRKIRAIGRNFTWSIQLNVDNVFDNDAYTISRVNSSGVVTAYRFNEGRSWILSSRFNF